MIIIVVFFSVLIAFMTAAIVPFTQYKSPSLPHINIKNFKIKRIKRLSFLFRGLYGADVKKDGVIYPMYIFHIIGYVIAIALVITPVILYFTTDLGLNIMMVDAFVFLGFCFVYFIVADIFGIISKKKDKKAIEHNKEIIQE